MIFTLGVCTSHEAHECEVLMIASAHGCLVLLQVKADPDNANSKPDRGEQHGDDDDTDSAESDEDEESEVSARMKSCVRAERFMTQLTLLYQIVNCSHVAVHLNAVCSPDTSWRRQQAL